MNVNQVGCPCTILEGDGCLGNLCPGCTSRLAALRAAATVALAVLTEEVGEVARALLDCESPERLRAELVQVAAVAVAWAEAIDTELGGAS